MVEYWATLALRVTDKNTGSPVEGATVSASGKQAQTGVDGIAALYDMPTNGPYPAPQYVLPYTVSKAGYYDFSGEARTNVEGDYFAEYPQLIPIPLPPEYSTVTYQSNPIAVPCTVNGQTVNSGSGIQVPSGTSIAISVPLEVTV